MKDAVPNFTPPSSPATLPRGWRSLLTGRWHRSSYVVAVLTLLLLVFCNVPGQVVTCVHHDEITPVDWQFGHGWPFTWVSRPISWGPFVIISTPNCWTFWDNGTGYGSSALAANFVIVTVLSVLCGSAFELWRRARARVSQLHLRDILVLLFLFSLAGAWYAAQVQCYAREKHVVRGELGFSSGGEIYGPHGIQSYATTPGGITWLRELFGHEHFQFLDRVAEVEVLHDGLPWVAQLTDVRAVEVQGNVDARELAHLERLPRLEFLDLWWMPRSLRYEFASTPAPRLALPPLPHVRYLAINNWDCDGLAKLPLLESLKWSAVPVDEPRLKEIAALPKLRRLRFEDCELPRDKLSCLASLKMLVRLELCDDTIDDDHLGQLANLTQISELELNSCPLTGGGLKYLAPLRQLKSLSLTSTKVDDQGVEHLLALPNLQSLDLVDTRITRASLPHLTRMKQLCKLSLSLGIFSAEDQHRLRTELPGCNVIFIGP